MGTYRVDPAHLHAAQTALAGVAEGARDALDVVRAQGSGVLASWHSAAGSEFAAGWHEWLAAAHTLLDVLDGFAELVGAAAAGYQHGENSVRGHVANLRESA